MKNLMTPTALILACSAVCAQDLPKEFKRTESGTGEVLAAQFPGQPAKALASKALSSLAKYYDGRPIALNAMASSDEAQVFYKATLGGKEVLGLLIASSNGCVVAVADRKKEFPGALDSLMKLARKNVPWCGTRELSWHNAQLTDGSGVLRLPEGWQITGANKGMVSAQGPQGAVDLGIWAQVYTPEAAAQFWAKPPLVARYVDPETAVKELMPAFSALMQQMGQGSMKFVRTLEQSKVDMGLGQSAFLHYEWDCERDGKSERYRTVSLVIMNGMGDGSWLYYSSSVTAPAAKMAENLKTLVEIWQSWKVDDRVYRERMNKAMQSMSETSRIINDTYENRQKTLDRTMRNWSYGFRGEAPVQDERTGRITDERVYENGVDLKKTVEWANRQEGYERYKILDPKELD